MDTINCSKSRNRDVYELVAIEHQITLKLINNQLHINCRMINHILHEDLRKRKICVKFCAHSLTEAHDSEALPGK